MITYYKNYKLNCKFVGVKAAPCDSNNTNQNTVVVTNCDTGKWIMFDFWGSRANPEINNKDYAVKAFQQFTLCAEAGRLTFDNFCYSFLQNIQSKKAKSMYNFCKKLTKKFDRIE